MKNVIQIVIAIVFLYSVSGLIVYAQEPGEYFKIIVIDEETGRGVPMVEMRSTNSVRYYTDNNGIIAFYEPGLMGRKVYFSITSPGYEYPHEFFGNPGKAFKVTKGDSVLIKIKRINVAERLYRFTGEGLYHHSLRVGHPIPIKQPVLNAEVTGMDASMALPYKGKIYWTWGDTKKISGFMGHFAVSGATSELPSNGGLDPDVGIDLTFFVDENGFSKKMCPVPGPGGVWNHWMGVLPDDTGNERLVLHYGRMKDLGVVYESGLAFFNDEKKIFEPFFRYSSVSPFWPKGHYLVANVNGENYHYFSFATPYSLRTRAKLEYIKDINSYEAFTCLKEGTKYNGIASEIDRNEEGEIIYSWKKNTDPVSYKRQKELIENGLMKQEEGWLQLCDIENGSRIKPHAGSVYWNKYRKRWVMIFQESTEFVLLGDIWYTEGDTPVGTWLYARKIATHNKYDFYNVTQHPFFDKDGGRYIYFDGTYTIGLSEAEYETPRYEYNPIMYRLDLNDPRLYLPAPIYFLTNVEGQSSYHLRESVDSLNIWNKIDNIPFFAVPPNRKIDESIAVYQYKENGQLKLHLKPSFGRTASSDPIFYGLPLFETIEEKLPGTWKCKADGYPLQMEIMMVEDKINISFKEEDIIVTEADFSNDTIVLNVKDTSDEVDYIITASILKGKMIGNVVNVETGETGHWEGERIDFLWKLSVSKAVVPLIEYQNKDGQYYYSTDSGLHKMKRSEKPICHVWRNPSTTLTLDFEAKPVPVIK